MIGDVLVDWRRAFCALVYGPSILLTARCNIASMSNRLRWAEGCLRSESRSPMIVAMSAQRWNVRPVCCSRSRG